MITSEANCARCMKTTAYLTSLSVPGTARTGTTLGHTLLFVAAVIHLLLEIHEIVIDSDSFNVHHVTTELQAALHLCLLVRLTIEHVTADRIP